MTVLYQVREHEKCRGRRSEQKERHGDTTAVDKIKTPIRADA
jgi:hypothetical protein